jgi:hypothetical protein
MPDTTPPDGANAEIERYGVERGPLAGGDDR